MTKAYAGVGSRKTPQQILLIMKGFATLAEELGWILRSGGAAGADDAFEQGVKMSHHKEIFLPWGAFNGRKSLFTHPSPLAMDIAEQVLGAGHWSNLTQGGRKLHGRNVHQVLGKNCNDPSKFLLAWTPEAKEVGGTATALKIARAYHVPIFNMAGPVDEHRLEEILRG